MIYEIRMNTNLLIQNIVAEKNIVLKKPFVH